MLILALLALACDEVPVPAPVAVEPLPVEIAEPPPPPPPEPEPPDPRELLNPVPAGFVDLCAPGSPLRCDIAYHGAGNFTGAPLQGYGAPSAWMLEQPAQALLLVDRALADQGLGLLIYDAYRPVRGTLAMVAWAQRTGQEHLLNGYIARRSGHNHGHTVDLTVYDRASGEILDMGCPFDTLDERAHTRDAQGQVLDNRLLLVEAMKAQGYRNYSKEWWHYRFPMEGTAPRDVPYGCFEAAEGAWQAPAGWDQPSYVPPLRWEPRPCAAASVVVDQPPAEGS